MKRMRIVQLAVTVAVVILSVTLAVAMAVGSVGPKDGAAARTQADITPGFIVDSSAALSGAQPNFQQIVSTGQLVYYNLTMTSASKSAYNNSWDNVNVTWRIETEWNTIVFAYGPNMTYSYYNESDHEINVYYTNASDSGDQSILVHVMADFDQDGIADLWERQFFNGTAVADETTDYDGDGWTDIEEYDNGTNPLVSNPKPGFLDQNWWVILLIAIVLIVVLLFQFVMRPQMKAKQEASEKKKIAAAVEVEKTLLGFDDLDDKPKK